MTSVCASAAAACADSTCVVAASNAVAGAASNVAAGAASNAVASAASTSAAGAASDAVAGATNGDENPARDGAGQKPGDGTGQMHLAPSRVEEAKPERAPQTAYASLLEKIDRAGFSVVACPSKRAAEIRTRAPTATDQQGWKCTDDADVQDEDRDEDQDEDEDEDGGIGLPEFVEFLQSLTSAELASWPGARSKTPLVFAAAELRGDLATLHWQFYNIEDDMLAALTREEDVDEERLHLVQWLCDFAYGASSFLPHIEYPILDRRVHGSCARCDGAFGQGFRCKFCRGFWCDHDVDHRLHYLRCDLGNSHIRRNRSSRGENTL